MIVTVVAVAGMGFVHSRISQVLGSHLITSVSWHHKSVHKVVIEEAWQLSFSSPGVDGEALFVEHLGYRGLVVCNFHHQVSTSVVVV